MAISNGVAAASAKWPVSQRSNRRNGGEIAAVGERWRNNVAANQLIMARRQSMAMWRQPG
jgi:hypothetical protein